MTQKLYYQDSSLSEFSAKIQRIDRVNEKTAVILDRTAFFPEGGGQPSDEGYIESTKIDDVQLVNGEILHFCSAAGDLEVGKTVNCRINYELRFARMQSHSGEHIVSGLVHNHFGFDNVGFHMDGLLMTVDFNGVLTAENLSFIEYEANKCVYKNVCVTTVFPSAEQLLTLEYRSKLDLTEDVRLVCIEGVDCCACCAPHVSRTGEIGIIKILSCMHHRGGVRLTLLCGKAAYSDYCGKHNQVSDIQRLLCAKSDEVFLSVSALKDRLDRIKYALYRETAKLCAYIIEHAPEGKKNLVLFCDDIDRESLIYIADKCKQKCSGLCVILSGSDEIGYTYAITSETVKLQSAVKQINADLNGSGGGRPELVQGKLMAKKAEINNYFTEFEAKTK